MWRPTFHKEQLGWRACFSLEQGVKRTVRLLREGLFFSLK